MSEAATGRGITETELSPTLAAASSFTNKAATPLPFGYFSQNRNLCLVFTLPAADL